MLTLKKNMKSFLFGMIGGIFVVIFFVIDNKLDGRAIEWISAGSTLAAVLVSLWLAKDRKVDTDITGVFFGSEFFDSYEQTFSSDSEEVLVINDHFLNVDTNIRLYNPSDFSKALYDLKINYVSEDNEVYSKKDLFLNDQFVNYISLSPKETNVLKVKSTSSNLGEEFLKLVPKEIFFSGINEKGKEIRIICDDYLEYLNQEKNNGRNSNEIV